MSANVETEKMLAMNAGAVFAELRCDHETTSSNGDGTWSCESCWEIVPR